MASSGWIPFELFEGSRIFIPAEVNGVDARVMLDSGASATVIDARFARTLQVKGTGRFIGQGAGGSAAYSPLSGVDITLGAITFRDTDAVGIDLAAVEAQLGHALPVVLGGDAFAQCVVDIDFAGRRIAFHDPARFRPPTDAEALAVTKAEENFAIQARVEGQPVSLVFDIGNASALNLFPNVWRRPGFLAGRRVSTTQNGGLGGMRQHSLATVSSLELAGSRFADIPTVLWANQENTAADGNIGLPILKRFRILVDLPHGRVLFAAPVDTATPFEANHAGLTLAPDPAGEKVLYVAPGSPGALSGLQAGDVIATLDGLTVKAWQARAGLRAWVYGPPGRTVRLGLGSGEARSLTFARYF